jgi:hypothetical protein
MSVRIDTENYRGANAVHLKRHKQFGSHCTVTKDALPIVEWLVSLDAVEKVDLGKVVSSMQGGFTKRVKLSTSGKKIKALLVGVRSAQTLTITLKSELSLSLVSQALSARW